MLFERINENKIKITLNKKDFKEEKIDYHDFMTNPLDSQKLLLDILNKAEKEIGFTTKDYQVRVDAFAMSNGSFIINVTRSSLKPIISIPSNTSNDCLRLKLKEREKIKNLNTLSTLIYSFESFEDYCDFIKSFSKTTLPITVAKNISLYTYENIYYLVLNNISIQKISKFSSFISEFAYYKSNPDLFMLKLQEFGRIVMKHNAIKTSINYFSKI